MSEGEAEALKTVDQLTGRNNKQCPQLGREDHPLRTNLQG